MKSFILIIAIFIVKCSFSSILDVKITEIMYNPINEGIIPGSELEFIELKNTGISAVDMSGVKIEGNAKYTFPSNTSIAAGGFLVIVSNSSSFSVRYPSVNIDGQYTGTLKNSGDNIYLITGVDTLINIKYNDNVPWPILADGNGFSMVPTVINPTNNQTSATDWKSSSALSGSSGTDDPTGTIFNDVYVNECLSHTDLPEVDVVELFNASNSSIDLSYWYVSDDRNKLKSYQFPNGTSIAAMGYLLIDESDFNPNGTGFSFNRSGDNVYLVSANSAGEFTGFEQGWSFDAQYNGTSFGVYTTSENERHFVAQSTKTLGAVNAYPKIGPVVITDISYNPDITSDEYVVIKNISDSVVNFWENTYTDSTWQISGIKFEFPINTSIQPQEKIVLCSLDVASFKIKYNLSANDQVFQYSGKLSNSGETVALWSLLRSDTAGVNNDSIFMPKILVDAVSYNDKSPWPVSADGQGDFLKRITNVEYGNDPINWNASQGSILNVAENVSPILEIYPNPSNNMITINFSKLVTGNLFLRNVQGEIIYESKINSNSFLLQRDNLSSGIYIVEIVGEKDNITQKIIFK